MPICRGSRLIESGTNLFHYSRQPDELIAYGQFDAKYSKHEGAMYFTTQLARRSNCVATASRQLCLVEFQAFGSSSGQDLFVGIYPDVYASHEADGYDGAVYPNRDPYTEIQPEIYSEEVAIFSGALLGLTNIRPL